MLAVGRVDRVEHHAVADAAHELGANRIHKEIGVDPHGPRGLSLFGRSGEMCCYRFRLTRLGKAKNTYDDLAYSLDLADPGTPSASKMDEREGILNFITDIWSDMAKAERNMSKVNILKK
jgi:hypothetical protein